MKSKNEIVLVFAFSMLTSIQPQNEYEVYLKIKNLWLALVLI